MPFDQMGHDVDTGCITCCDEKASRKTYRNRDASLGQQAQSFFMETRRWYVAGSRPHLHERGSEEQVSLADRSWIIGKTQAEGSTLTNQLRSFSNNQGSVQEFTHFLLEFLGQQRLCAASTPSLALVLWAGTAQGFLMKDAYTCAHTVAFLGLSL